MDNSPPQSEPDPLPQNPISSPPYQTLTLQDPPQDHYPDDQEDHDSSPPPSLIRRPNNRKKGPLHKKKLQKVQSLTKTLNPIPFIPPQTLHFGKREEMLKKLGLWEFVHIEFERSIRTDLIAQLIVNYDGKSRCSYVNGFRINLNRPTMGRALKLPVRKEKGGSGDKEAVVLDLDEYDEEESRFVGDFLSNWMILCGDMEVIPEDVMSLWREVKGRDPEKVDWTGLIWFMVEKELSQGVNLKDCYYASHLQYLIKSQREEVFEMEEPEVGEGNKVVEVEENVMSTLGQENSEREEVKYGDAMDIEESKEDDVAQGDWNLDGMSSRDGLFLQRCNVEEYRGMTAGEETKFVEEGRRAFIGGEENGMTKEEEGEGEEEGDDEFSLTPKVRHFESDVFAGDLHQGIDMDHISYGVNDQFDYQPTLGMISSEDPSSFFSCGMKRDISQSHEHLQDTPNGCNKRLKIGESSGLPVVQSFQNQRSSEFDFCLDQIQLWVGKARETYQAKEIEAENLLNANQVLNSEIQQKENLIEYLKSRNYEELQKKDQEISRLDRELFVMGNLINGYKGALKATRKDFDEYREKCQLPEEPMYKDVGPGGLMLSKMEIERMRLKREEENRVNRETVEQTVKKFEEGCVIILEGYFNDLKMMDTKLLELKKEVSQMKEVSRKGKASEMVDSAAANE